MNMNRNGVWVLFVAAAALLGLYMYTESNRFEIVTQSGEGGRTYKFDRKTGRIWSIHSFGEEEIEHITNSNKDKQESPEEKAIRLVQLSYVLGGAETADETVKKLLQTQKGVLKIYGWKARKIDDQTYLVVYAFDQGKPPSQNAFIFEVNLTVSLVRRVDDDPLWQAQFGQK